MNQPTTEPNGGRVAKNTLYLTAALVGQKILSFLYVLLLARLIGVNSAGDYFSSLSFIGLFSVFIDLGLTQSFIRQTARQREQGEKDFPVIIGFKMVSAVIVSATMLVLISYLITIGRFHTEFIFIKIAALVMIIDSFVITFYGYLRGIQRLEYESWGVIIHRLTIMFVGLVSLQLGASPIVTMYALLAGSVANLFYVLSQLIRKKVRFYPTWSNADLRRLLKIATPFAWAALFIAIYSSSDNVLLSIFSGRRAVGLYATSSKIISAFNQIFPAALVAAIFPAMSVAFVQDRQRLAKIFHDALKYLIIIAVPITVVLAILATPIMRAGWGKVWLDAVWPLRVLLIGLPWLFVNYPIGYLLNATNQQTKNTINIAITVIVNIGLNLIFIANNSYRSVAVVSTISSILLVLLGLRYVRKTIVIAYRSLASILARTILAGLIVSLIGWYLLPFAHSGPPVIIITGTLSIAYLGLAFVLRLVTRTDIIHLVRRLRRT